MEIDSKFIVVSLLLLGAVLHLFQFRLRRKHKEDGSSNARVQVLVKGIMGLLVWNDYEWGNHFLIIFALFDMVGILKELPERKGSKILEYGLILVDALILIMAIWTLMSD